MPNVEKVTPSVEIEIGGKIRRLVCDMWALAMMENASGESAMYGELFKDMSMNKLITIVWACLLEDPEVSEETQKKGIPGGRKMVAKWMDMSRFEELFSACKRAVEIASASASGDDDEDSEGNAPAAQPNGIG